MMTRIKRGKAVIMADGNRFKSRATKTTQDEDDGKICIEQIVADALANMGASEQPKTKAKRATKDSKVNNSADLQMRHQKLFTLARHLSVGHFSK